MSKKYWIVSVVLVLLVAALLVAKSVQKKQPAASAPAGQNSSASQQDAIKIVAPAEVPQQLQANANLPFEQGAQILQNFEAKDPATGKTQSTRIYVSAKTLDENFGIYQKYMQDNGWNITASINQPAIKNLDANKGDARLDVTIAQDSKTKQVTVNVSLIQ